VSRTLLKGILANPSDTQIDWAVDIKRSKSPVNKKLQALKTEHLVEVTLGRGDHLSV
jgi:hypothetical protein